MYHHHKLLDYMVLFGGVYQCIITIGCLITWCHLVEYTNVSSP